MAFLKPQNPMTKGSDYFYPLTTADQVIMDGGYRLDEIVGKTKKSTIMLYANGWSAEAPYCFSIAVQGLSDKVNMKMLPHFPEDFEGKQAMKEETAKISFATREGNILTFECWDEVPTMDLPIDIEIEAMYPIKGASIEMNYSVVGGVEEPAEPTENMIWVNTDQDITDWVFSKNEPKNPEEGMIWFATGDNSDVSFFTLRMDEREFDEVYPISAKQYISDAWVSVEVKSYQNGKWVYWITYLYNSGDECTDITGGWSAKAWATNQHFTGTTPTVTKGEKSITASINCYNQTLSGVLHVAKDVDLTNAIKLTAIMTKIETTGDITNTSTYVGGWSAGIYIVPRNATYYDTNSVASSIRSVEGKIGKFENETLEILLDEISGMYDIVIGMDIYPGNKTATVTVECESIALT